MRSLILLLIPTALLGCPLEEDDSYQPLPVYVTMNGYRYEFKDLGSLGVMSVSDAFDAAVEDAAAKLLAEYGIPLAETRAVVRGYWVRVIDAFLFGAQASSTGYATGAIEPQNRKMYLALYRRQKNASGPVWTHFDWGGGNVHSGIPSGPYLAALQHELLHHFGLIPGTHKVGPSRDHVTEVEP